MNGMIRGAAKGKITAGSKRLAPAASAAPARISVTRALKNARHLQKVAPHIMPPIEPAQGFGSVIALETLAQLHRTRQRDKIGLDAKLTRRLKSVRFPAVGKKPGGALFNGTLYFARIEFTLRSQGKAVVAVSPADVAAAIAYAKVAAAPIRAYARQYGPNRLAVSQAVLSYAVTLARPKYNDAQLQGWVKAIVADHGLPDTACVVVLNPVKLTNTSASRASGYGGYHDKAKVPYIFVNLYGQDLTVADEAFAYAQNLSHEIAEMVVDPRADGRNPEVCDGCGPNCQNVFLDFFGDKGYLQTTQTWPPKFAYRFYINAIVQPAAATACPAPASACAYAPPLRAAPPSAAARPLAKKRASIRK